MHPANADQPNLSGLVIPNKKRISDFQETNKYSCDWEQVIPSHEYLGINDIERRADERAPYVRTIPPSTAKTFCQATEKIDEA